MKGIWIHTDSFPPKGYHAITLFPFVFYKGKKPEQHEVRHEQVHMYQQLALLIVPFYILYGLFWVVGMLRYHDGDKAYHAIPFERSAYRLEHQEEVNGWRLAFDWMKKV